MEKLRILIISNLYPPQAIGGYERAIADYARLLHSHGHTVLVLTTNAEEYAISSIQGNLDPPIHRSLSLCGAWTKEGCDWFSPEVVNSLFLKNIKTLNEEIQTFQPQVCLLGNMMFLGLPLVETILAFGIPVAHYIMDTSLSYFPEDAPRNNLYKYITCSDWIRLKLQQMGYPVETAQTIYPGAAVEEFYQAELPAHDRLRIAYASLIMQHKGADVLIEALCLLNAAGVDFTATIAGGSFQPEFLEALREYVEAEDLQEKIKFPGTLSRQELKQLYRSHNVLVFPSRWEEPFGISQVEAMAAGLTLVTSGTGGAKEIVKHGEDGLVFESENPLSLAEILSNLPKYPTQWKNLTLCGQKLALSEFSQTRTVEQIELFLSQLVSSNL